MSLLENDRGNGRNDYPVRAMWNSVLAGVIYQHKSIASLIRELSRNISLLELCGFDIFKKENAVPKAWDYSRFLKKLFKYQDEIEKLFNKLCQMIQELLPDFGENLAIDGKALESHAKTKCKDNLSEDGRRDTDADWGKKVYRGKHKNGSLWKKVTLWFGYTLHLIADSKYELPVAFTISKASQAEQPIAHKLLDKLETEQPEILERCRYFTADRGYDDTKLITRLYDDYSIKPVIDIRNCWQTKEETRLLDGFENVVHNYKGDIFCFCPVECIQRKMGNGGFEKDRGMHKYLCPAKEYGFTCKGQSKCKIKRFIRIDLGIDRRVFTPVARGSYKWKRLYAKRTAVERVNSRLATAYGFEEHFIRGKKKMRMQCTLAFCIMLTLAVGRI